MTKYNNPRLLTPPREEEEIYPYRRVWPSLGVLVGVLFGLAAGLYVLVGFIGLNIPEGFWRLANIGMALLPLAVWLIVSLYREIRVEQPRTQLVSITAITALAANAVGIPLENWLEIDQWLSLASTFDRILGYGVTAGLIHIGIIYAVVSLLTWPHAYRIRSDAIAFTVAGTIGYISVLNLHTAFAGTPSPDVMALRIFSTATVHLTSAVILAYGLAQLRFDPRNFIAMPLSVIGAALAAGFGITFRAGLVNGGFVLGVSGTRPLFGLVFSLILVVGGFVVMAFLFLTSERRAREADEGTEE